MKTTGWALKEAIKEHELRRDTAARSFNGTLKAFADDKKQSPQEVVEEFLARERSIASLQVAQAEYNLKVRVKHDGREITLCEAVKLIGGLGRAEKMYRSATGAKPDRYSSYADTDVRDPKQERAKETISPKEAAVLASAQARVAGRLRAAIATGNGTEVEIESLSPSLFE